MPVDVRKEQYALEQALACWFVVLDRMMLRNGGVRPNEMLSAMRDMDLVAKLYAQN